MNSTRIIDARELDRRSESFTRWLSHAERLVFLGAMLLVIVLEGACLYWLRLPMIFHLQASPVSELYAEVLNPVSSHCLLQAWILGGLAVLGYRVLIILFPPAAWSAAEAQQNRKAFVRLWTWTAAIGAAQFCMLYLVPVGGQ